MPCERCSVMKADRLLVLSMSEEAGQWCNQLVCEPCAWAIMEEVRNAEFASLDP
jgi:hypothetical protein